MPAGNESNQVGDGKADIQGHSSKAGQEERMRVDIWEMMASQLTGGDESLPPDSKGWSSPTEAPSPAATTAAGRAEAIAVEDRQPGDGESEQYGGWEVKDVTRK